MKIHRGIQHLLFGFVFLFRDTCTGKGEACRHAYQALETARTSGKEMTLKTSLMRTESMLNSNIVFFPKDFFIYFKVRFTKTEEEIAGEVFHLLFQ